MNDPLISVITVTYNVKEIIDTTINSVINQPGDNLEYIIIDGNSTDGTQSAIKKYGKKIDVFISEPDKGIPDALNKGVRVAKGKYLIFILAGDVLMELPYKQLINEDADLVCFPVSVTSTTVIYPKINNWLKIKNTIPHQGAFFKRTSHLVHDLKYRFFCDFALCQVYYKNKLKFKTYNAPIVAYHGLDGATSNKKNFHEVFSIIKENYGRSYRLMSLLYWKYYGLLKRLKLKKV